MDSRYTGLQRLNFSRCTYSEYICLRILDLMHKCCCLSNSENRCILRQCLRHARCSKKANLCLQWIRGTQFHKVWTFQDALTPNIFVSEFWIWCIYVAVFQNLGTGASENGVCAILGVLRTQIYAYNGLTVHSFTKFEVFKMHLLRIYLSRNSGFDAYMLLSFKLWEQLHPETVFAPC